MDEELHALLIQKSFTEEQIETIKENDDSLGSIGDLAAGAENEADARSWAAELGLSGRVTVGRFVQSWLEARARLSSTLSAPDCEQLASEVASPPPIPPANVERAMSPKKGEAASQAAYRAATQGMREALRQALQQRGLEQQAAEALASVGRVTEALAPRQPLSLTPLTDALENYAPVISPRPRAEWQEHAPQEAAKEEEFLGTLPEVEETTKPGGLSDFLCRVLRAKKVTAFEVADLEKQLEPRTCRELNRAADSFIQAVRIAKDAGMLNKTSQENFARAWQECRRLVEEYEYEPGIQELLADKDFEGCQRLLLSVIGGSEKRDLVPLLRGVLAHVAEQELRAVRRKDAHVIPTLATAYGADIAERARRRAQVEEANLRWRWTLRTLFAPRYAVALQKRLLHDYRADHFKSASKAINAKWREEGQSKRLEDKMEEIEVLCMDQVLRHILPRFGFTPDAAGAREMKKSINQHAKNCPEVRQLQVDTSKAIMQHFKL